MALKRELRNQINAASLRVFIRFFGDSPGDQRYYSVFYIH